MMKSDLIYQIDKMQGSKIIETYRIYSTGDCTGFDTSDGSKYSIQNFLPHFFRKAGISMRDFFPSMRWNKNVEQKES